MGPHAWETWAGLFYASRLYRDRYRASGSVERSQRDALLQSYEDVCRLVCTLDRRIQTMTDQLVPLRVIAHEQGVATPTLRGVIAFHKALAAKHEVELVFEPPRRMLVNRKALEGFLAELKEKMAA